MGLSSSQARILTLTSRQHAIEYKAQKLQAQKLQLANDSDKVYQEYLDRLDAKKIQYRVVNNDGSMYFTDANFGDLTSHGYLFNVGGKICYDLNQVKKALTGLHITDVDLSASDSYTLLTTLVSEGYVVIMEVGDDTNSDYYYDKASGSIKLQENDSEVMNIKSPSTFDTFVTEETKLSGTTDKNIFTVFGNTSVSTSTTIQEVSDEKALRKAEAQYEADMHRINNKDSRYDTELSQLETERNAIKNEIETMKTVANDNVDRTFKLFT